MPAIYVTAMGKDCNSKDTACATCIGAKKPCTDNGVERTLQFASTQQSSQRSTEKLPEQPAPEILADDLEPQDPYYQWGKQLEAGMANAIPDPGPVSARWSRNCQGKQDTWAVAAYSAAADFVGDWGLRRSTNHSHREAGSGMSVAEDQPHASAQEGSLVNPAWMSSYTMPEHAEYINVTHNMPLLTQDSDWSNPSGPVQTDEVPGPGTQKYNSQYNYYRRFE